MSPAAITSSCVLCAGGRGTRPGMGDDARRRVAHRELAREGQELRHDPDGVGPRSGASAGAAGNRGTRAAGPCATHVTPRRSRAAGWWPPRPATARIRCSPGLPQLDPADAPWLANFHKLLGQFAGVPVDLGDQPHRAAGPGCRPDGNRSRHQDHRTGRRAGASSSAVSTPSSISNYFPSSMRKAGFSGPELWTGSYPEKAPRSWSSSRRTRRQRAEVPSSMPWQQRRCRIPATGMARNRRKAKAWQRHSSNCAPASPGNHRRSTPPSLASTAKISTPRCGASPACVTRISSRRRCRWNTPRVPSAIPARRVEPSCRRSRRPHSLRAIGGALPSCGPRRIANRAHARCCRPHHNEDQSCPEPFLPTCAASPTRAAAA